MGLWDNIKDGFKSGQAGKGPNYVRKQREAAERARIEIVERAYRRVQGKYQSAPADLQYLDGDYRVTVKSGYGFDQDSPTTEILIYPRRDNPSGSHWHIVIDDQGNEIMNEWRQK